MRPATDLEQAHIPLDGHRLVQVPEAGIGVGMQVSAAVFHQGLGLFRPAVGRVAIKHVEEESGSADPKSKVRLNETIERAAAAMTEVQRESAIAVVLGDDVHAALDELATQWLKRETPIGCWSRWYE